MTKWIYFDTTEPEHGQNILVLFSGGCPAVGEQKYDSSKSMAGNGYGRAEAWIPAPEKRKKWVPCKPHGSLFGRLGGVECRFKRSVTSEWLYGRIEAISLDGLSFYCGRVGADPSWVQACEVVEQDNLSG